MSEDLFVYGTLHPDKAPNEIAGLVKNFRPLGEGTIRGKLYDLGAFPGVVVDGERKDKIAGSVFALPEGSEALTSLDEYEEFKPSDPLNSLFVRAKRIVTLTNGKRRHCWVYLYNGQLPQATLSADARSRQSH